MFFADTWQNILQPIKLCEKKAETHSAMLASFHNYILCHLTSILFPYDDVFQALFEPFSKWRKNYLTLPLHALHKSLFFMRSVTNYLRAIFMITVLTCRISDISSSFMSSLRDHLFSELVTSNHVDITCGISSSSTSWLSDHLNGFSPYTWPPFVFSDSSNTRAQYSRFTAGLFPPNSAGRISWWQCSWSVVMLLPCTCI